MESGTCPLPRLGVQRVQHRRLIGKVKLKNTMNVCCTIGAAKHMHHLAALNIGDLFCQPKERGIACFKYRHILNRLAKNDHKFDHNRAAECPLVPIRFATTPQQQA